MERRDFLKASSLVAAVSLLDACSREEVQYIEQAVTGTDSPGASVWKPGVCQQCMAGCGIRVRTVDGKAKKIEGNDLHPVNRGGLCALGQSSLQGLYNPDRVRTPLKRVGKRGDGQFEEIGWEEALGETAQAFVQAQRQDPANCALLTGTSSSLVRGLLTRLSRALKASPVVICEALEAQVEREASRIVFGIEDFPVYDLPRTDYLLSIGAPFLDRWRSPVHYARALAEMRRGRPGRRGKLVQAEARMSITAATADEWLPLLPGMEGIFARALAGVILHESLATPTAIKKYGQLFASPPPELTEAAKMCDLPEEKIQRVARELCGAENRVVMGGGAAAAHTNGLFNMVALFGLNLLLDNFGRAGGIFSPLSFDMDRSLRLSGTNASGRRFETLGEWARRLPSTSASPGGVVLVCEADPVYVAPGGWKLPELFDSIQHVTALSSFLDETALHADIVFPISADLERVDVVEPSISVGVPVLGLNRPVVEPTVDSRHPGDIVLALATALGEPFASAFPWKSCSNLAETLIQEELDQLPVGKGIDFPASYEEAHSRGGIWSMGSPTQAPDGPLEKAPPLELPGFEGEAEEYPFHLVPFESVKVADGRGANRPWLQALPDPLSTVMWGSWAEISVKDAEQLGVATGDQLRIESPRAAIEVPAIVSPAVRPGLIGVPLGNGHRDFGRYARRRGASPMDLLGGLSVKGTSAPAWAATRVRLKRIGKGSVALFGPGLRVHEETVQRARVLEKRKGKHHV